MGQRSYFMRQRIIGCILGGAIGDGLGEPLEGTTGGTTIPINTILDITDDTQLTLATCQAIIATGHVDPERIAGRFLEWLRARRLRGLGAATLGALRALQFGGHWALVGRRGEMAAGNGAAMRIAPLAFMLDPDREDHRETICDVCRITHHNDEAYAGALAVIAAIRAAASGRPLDASLLETAASTLPDTAVRDRLRLLYQQHDQSLASLAQRHGASGHVVESVPLAIAAASHAADRSFEEIITEVVMLGGDADTIGSITGQIVGASIGIEGIPESLMERLRERRMIVETAERFAAIIETTNRQGQ